MDFVDSHLFHLLKNKHFIVFLIVFVLILYEFSEYLDIEINTNVILFALGAGGFGALMSYQKKHGRIHFGVMLFLIGFIMLLVTGVPLLGGSSILDHEAYWTIGDKSKITMLGVIAFLGLVLIFVNFKAYMQNWIFARPMSLRKGG